MLPEEGQVRTVKDSKGRKFTFTIAAVLPYKHGDRAWEVFDTRGRYWIFAAPPPKI